MGGCNKDVLKMFLYMDKTRENNIILCACIKIYMYINNFWLYYTLVQIFVT